MLLGRPSTPRRGCVEGEWQPVFAAIEGRHQAVRAMGCPDCGHRFLAEERDERRRGLQCDCGDNGNAGLGS